MRLFHSGYASAPLATPSLPGVSKQLIASVKDYGATGNGVVLSTGAMTNGSPNLTASGALFTTADIGKSITVAGALSTGATLSATINSITSSTQIVLSTSATATVIGAAVFYCTDDTTAIQLALSSHNALFIPEGHYGISSTLFVGNNQIVTGSSKVSTTIHLLGTTSVAITTAATISNLTLADFALDCAQIGTGININQPNSSNITLRNLQVKNVNAFPQPNLLWPISIGAITNGTAGSPTNNVLMEGCDIGNNTPHLENCIFINVTDLRIKNNYFHDVLTTNNTAGLAIYAYCRNVIIEGNIFANIGVNLGSDCYIQQSDTITYSNNVHRRSVTGTSPFGLLLMSIVNAKIDDNTFYDSTGTANGIIFGDVVDLGSLSSFNGNANLYPYSQSVTISNNHFWGLFQPIRVYSPPYGPSTIPQGAINQMIDITVSNNDCDNIGAGVVSGGVGYTVGGALIQNLLRVYLHENHVGGSSAFNNGIGIEVVGNAGVSSTTTAQAIKTTPLTPTLGTTGSSGVLTAGTYTAAVTYVDSSGRETLASPSQTQAISGTQGLQITSPVAYGAAIGYYAYVSAVGGSTLYRQQSLGSPTAIATDLTLLANPTITGANPPTLNKFVQSISVTAITTGMIAGQWLNLDTSGSLETVYIYATTTSPNTITTVCNKSHTSGVALAAGTPLGSFGGINPCRITGGSIGYTTTGTSVGLYITNASNLYIDGVDLSSVLTGGGTSAPVNLGTGGGFVKISNCVGFNPRGWQTAPGIPSTGVALTNPFFQDCFVTVANGGGVVTSVQIAGVTVGGQGTYFCPAGKTVLVNYTSTFAWAWYAI